MSPLNVYPPLGFDTQNFTQLLLQPFSADSWVKPHPRVNKFSIVMALGQWPPVLTEKQASFIVRNGGPTRPEGCFLSRFMQEMAHPVPTKAFLQPSPEAAMLFAPFRCTHPPPPVPPFLLKQNLSPKNIAGSDVMSTKCANFNWSH